MLKRVSRRLRSVFSTHVGHSDTPALTINEARDADLDARDDAEVRRSTSQASFTSLSPCPGQTIPNVPSPPNLSDVIVTSFSAPSSVSPIQTHSASDVEVAIAPRLAGALVDDILDMVFKRLTACRHLEKYSASHAAMPFILASVCKQWRDVALESSLLWSHLYLPCGTNRKHNYELYTELVLQRSRDVPLHILLFDCDENSLSRESRALERVLEAVSRWRAITVFGKAAKWDHWRQILHRDTPLLEYCLVAGEEPQWEDEQLVQWHPDEEDLRLLPNAPNLQNFEASWIPILCSVVSPPPHRGSVRWLGPGPSPSSSLTCIRLFLLNAEAERVHDLLRSLPQLEELCLAILKLGVNIAQWAVAPGGSYSMPELRSMDLRGVAPLVFVPAQGRINAENLESVTLQPECIHYLALFLSSNGNAQRVRSITILGGLARLSVPTLTHLRMLTGLECIVLDTDVADDFFDNMLSSMSMLWPRLHTIHIDRDLPSDVVRHSLLRYIQAKNLASANDTTVAAFRHVCVNEDTWLAHELEALLGSRREYLPLDDE